MLWIDGRARSKDLKDQIRLEVGELVRRFGRAPRLAVALIGNDPASELYVHRKEKAAESVGISTVDRRFPQNIAEDDVIAVIDEWNQDDNVDGILLQLPFPQSLNQERLLSTVSIEKDVDGLHPTSQGWLMRGKATFEPCTPKGIIHLIEYYASELGRDLSGARAVVVGRSVLVGRPLASMLLNRDFTVTACHSRTQNLSTVTREADVLIVATGKPALIDSSFVKPGAIVLDVGINRLKDGSIVGDVDTASVQTVASALTPVPGGVGPMTIAMLLQNTLEAARMRLM